jgi:hypothetical protein
VGRQQGRLVGQGVDDGLIAAHALFPRCSRGNAETKAVTEAVTEADTEADTENSWPARQTSILTDPVPQT